MDKSDFSSDKTADEDIWRGIQPLKESEYLPALRMSPPASLHDFADGRFDEIWNRALGGRQDDPLQTHERQCLFTSHIEWHA